MSVGGSTVGGMTLTSQLRDSSSRVARLFAAGLRDLDSVSDWEDRYRIDRVGWHLALQGILPAWELEEFLKLLGSTRRVADLRAVVARALTVGRPR